MTLEERVLAENQKTWNLVADRFKEASALPVWGPFGIGKDLNLLPEIKNKTFLELGCGSGRSVKYLIDNGAKKVYGLDFSETQLKEAESYNQEAVNNNTLTLVKSTMEKKVDVEPVDFVVSIYALGWTVDPEVTLKNIYSYLKPGGLFIWSWDHSIFTDVQYENGNFVVIRDYHNEEPTVIDNWRKDGATANITYRKTATWFQLLRKAGFEIVNYYEPEPKDMSHGHDDPNRNYSIQKAKKVPCSFIFVCKKN